MAIVSVIIPVYNDQANIITAIKSLQIQTYTDWEAVIVDDCSTDDTYQTIHTYIQENSITNIKLIKNTKNQGCYISKNTAIKNSTGEYITMLDSDDTYVPTKLQRQVDVLDKDSTKMAVKHGVTRAGKKMVDEISIMYRRSVIDKIGYYDSVRFGADSEFKARLNKIFGKQTVVLSDVLYLATKRPGSLTTDKTSKPARVNYVKALRKWHSSTKSPYMPFPLDKRPFPVLKNMLP